MRTRNLVFLAALAGVTSLASGSVATAPGRAAAASARHAAGPPLLPVSEGDQTSLHESGCQLSFNTRHDTLVYAIGHSLMIRTAAGRAVCPITDRQFSAFTGGGSRSCGGLRLAVRRTGRVTGNEASDSASFPATLTVTGRGRPWTVRGFWGTAC